MTTDHPSRHKQLPEPLRSAVRAHESGQLDSAYPLYRKFVAENPKHPTALQLFGLLLSQLRQYEPAIVLMRESLNLFPDQPEVANNLGNALFLSDQFDDAIDSYMRALRLVPKYADAWRNLGLCQARSGRYREALDSLQRCVETTPQDAAAWLALGNVQRDLGAIDDAMASFEKALALRPDYAEAHHNLGVCMRLRHRPEEALTHYDAAKKAGLDGAELHHNCGNAYIDLQQPERAIDAYRAALQRNPGDLDTHRNLNSLLWQQEQLDDYLESYRDVLARHPDAEPLRLAYATALSQTDAYTQAEQVLRQGLQHGGESAELMSRLAFALEGQGRWDDALAMHASAVAKKDSVPNQRISYGRALLACRRPDEALRQIQGAAAQMPLNQRALAYLGLCWRMLGDERDAVLNDYQNLVRTYDVPIPAGYRDAAEFNDRLRAVLEPLHIGKRHPAEQTLRGGSQTSGNLFDRPDPDIQALIAAFRTCVHDYIGRFPQDREHPLFARRRERFDFSASWSVRLAPCGFHTMHTHPLGWISSAYYVDVPPEIVDTDAHGGGLKFGEPDIDIGEDGRARRHVQPAIGRLLLFPSYMWHGTVPFEADDPRMTVAFDVVPDG